MLPAWVTKYVGLSFEEYNCWQLVCLIYQNELNITLDTYKNEYYNALDRENIATIYTREMAHVYFKVDKPQAFDVIVCRVRGQPWHTGIVIEPNEMLHTQRYTNAVVEHYDRFNWKSRILGFYRYN